MTYKYIEHVEHRHKCVKALTAMSDEMFERLPNLLDKSIHIPCLVQLVKEYGERRECGRRSRHYNASDKARV